MKKHLLSAILSIFSIMAMAQQRTTLWLQGGPLTSALWLNAQDAAQADGYNFTEVNIFPYSTNITSNSIEGWASDFNQRMVDNNHNDVLGIGHDAGGLILRHMAMNQQSTRLSAMILDGVPNHGGKIFHRILRPNSSTPSEAQSMVQKLLNLRTGAQNCHGCRTLEATQEWLGYFSAPENTTYYELMLPNSPTITNMVAPDIPFAVIWGNEDDDARTLTRVMNSWASRSSDGKDDEYINCLETEIRQRLIDASQQFLLGTLTAIGQLVGASAKLNATNPSSASAVVQAKIDALVTQLRAIFQLSKEIREMLECKLIHEALNAEWNLMVSPYEIVETVVILPAECNCFEACDGEEDPQVWAWCYYDCLEYGCNNDPQVITYIAYQPHDGLLTRDEQLLAGAAILPYEAKGCNHLQEQFWKWQPVKAAFTDLFNGGAGAAFVVPK